MTLVSINLFVEYQKIGLDNFNIFTLLKIVIFILAFGDFNFKYIRADKK